MLEASDAKLSTELTEVNIIGVPVGQCNANCFLTVAWVPAKLPLLHKLNYG
jgi:hypothetical protein